MSVQELQARIEQKSAEVKRQKAILKELEHSESLLQRQLNAIRDPVARLPFEISSEIFLQCLPPYRLPQPGALDIPMLFLNVCAAWSNIAESVPALWAGIEIHFPRAKGFEKALNKWLKRARGRLLHIRLGGSIDRRVTALILGRYSSQVEILDISFESVEVPENEVHELLGGTELHGQLPRLRTLQIRGGDKAECSWVPLLQLLRCSPELVELYLGHLSFGDVYEEDENILLPNLRRLTYIGESVVSGNTLKCLSAPGLESLILSPAIFEDNHNCVLSFLQRSTPPLQELQVRNVYTAEDFPSFDECLALVPTVKRLELRAPQGRTVEQLFTILEQSRVLPDLQSFCVRCIYPLDISSVHWNSFARGLWARRSKLRTVRVFLASTPWSGILAPFRRLLGDGVDIHIACQPDIQENLLLPPVVVSYAEESV